MNSFSLTQRENGGRRYIPARRGKWTIIRCHSSVSHCGWTSINGSGVEREIACRCSIFFVCLSHALRSVTTTAFAQEESQAIEKLNPINDQIQAYIDQQRCVQWERMRKETRAEADNIGTYALPV
jgi:hypothetical protein